MFKVYIMNLGKYNEGNIIGQWLTLPAEQEDMQEIFNNIGLNDLYEEFFIGDYESQLENFYISEYDNLNKLNQIANNLSVFNEYELKVIDALLEGNYITEDDLTEEYDLYNHSVVELENNFLNDDLNLGYAVIDEFYNNDLSLVNNIDFYFDYISFGNDLYLDFDIITEDYDKEYKKELEEMDKGEFCDWFIESIGTVEDLGQATMEKYFDYEKFGRDIRLNGAYIADNGIVIL